MAQLGRSIFNRSRTQAQANTESWQATVTRTYRDSHGNISAADIRTPNGGNDIIQVPNRTTLKLAIGDKVILNYVNGSRHLRQITGAAGAGAVNNANAEESQSSPFNSTSPLPLSAEVDGEKVLLAEASDLFTEGYVVAPGANVYLTYISPSIASGTPTDGTLTITAKVLVLTSLPDIPNNYPDGTLLDLVDSYGTVLGMYRFSVSLGEWVRRDNGSSTPNVEWAEDTYTGDNSTTVFPLTGTPLGIVAVSYSGADIYHTGLPFNFAYTGGSVVFNAAPKSGKTVAIRYLKQGE